MQSIVPVPPVSAILSKSPIIVWILPSDGKEFYDVVSTLGLLAVGRQETPVRCGTTWRLKSCNRHHLIGGLALEA